MNNIVWSCCVIHNLLLGIDGLDKLWTKEDYLSTWSASYTRRNLCLGCNSLGNRYADPDAESHPDFDVQTREHAAIIEARAMSRSRLFRRAKLGQLRPGHMGIIPPQESIGNEDEEIVQHGDQGQSLYVYCCCLVF
jgi:hypothetical protein